MGSKQRQFHVPASSAPVTKLTSPSARAKSSRFSPPPKALCETEDGSAPRSPDSRQSRFDVKQSSPSRSASQDHEAGALSSNNGAAEEIVEAAVDAHEPTRPAEELNELAEARLVLAHAYTAVAAAGTEAMQRAERLKLEEARCWVEELEERQRVTARAIELGVSPPPPFSLIRIPNIGGVPPKASTVEGEKSPVTKKSNSEMSSVEVEDVIAKEQGDSKDVSNTRSNEGFDS